MTSQNYHVLVRRFLRFCIVGGASTLAFSLLTWMEVSGLELNPTIATVISYLVLVPLNFFAHRNFTFVSSGHLSSESLRFILLHSFNLGLSAFGMHVVVAVLHIHYAWGIGFSAIIVPMIVFVTMNAWVFNRGKTPKNGFNQH